MRKIYFLGLVLLSCFTVKSQSVFQIKNMDNGGAVVSADQTFNTATGPGGIDYLRRFTIKNVSASSQTIAVQKYEDAMNTNTATPSDKAYSYFCFDTYCYPATTFSAQRVLAAGETFSFLPKYDEASVYGSSSVRYKIYNKTDVTDVIELTFNYAAVVSVKENTAIFTKVSSVYPNPAVSKAYVDVAVERETNATIAVYNSLGSMVSNKQVDLNKGINKVSIDSDELNSGMYFISISQGNQKITKKVTITK